ncbi:E3 ubiquitin-protein ligase MIB2-like [Physella acuta]|uniref:E3 ubiquitin-protein ligase MIB2-like n=1 Tax=Physella acuta TaxID=109671 RepID=UPI0027DDC60B|nr:E3 ubiquitin-protein ligase MIB2-like [Physella acuta]
MNDKHLTEHRFLRIDRPNESSVLVQPRSEYSDQKVQSRGIFRRATVSRGLDWKYGEQDGVPGNAGKVIDITDGVGSGRSHVRVLWSTYGRNFFYRLGHGGQVDLKFVKPGMGLIFYKGHLPILGKSLKPPARFKVGDQVTCEISENKLKNLQLNHGGWRDEDNKYLKQKGQVFSIDDYGDVLAVFKDGRRITFNPEALTFLQPLTVADMLTDPISLQVLRMDINKAWVVKALERRLVEHGQNFETAQSLAEAARREDRAEHTTAVPNPSVVTRLSMENRKLREQLKCKICLERER